ncbi:BTAD domain-containing putative transcriptional regulator [Kitasatospora sp. MAP5-34]|uniref:BTAD domain-containing putative transcriptional regulator n=1 Tax=Kitasatospora sp. MAP5-34 TaxID=3035102 RepID=UPI0024756FA7|nr:BTAD domain-containing putative transcriptional regulator [Kitasatospora sp. MAP5-34]MDH6579914.1 DNA-binding SARP family transcriptional activator [Kitasatospora sp. MAP5-34]
MTVDMRTVDLLETEPPSGRVRFSVLGPLVVEAGGRSVRLGSLKQRQVLALLLCRANSPVSVDLLTDTLWQGEPPRTARKNLQVYMSGLRKLLGDETGHDRLGHHLSGYQLQVAPDELDVVRFEALARAGRAAAARGESALAARLLGQALDLRRGQPLLGLCCSEPLQAEAERLDARYLAAYEDWAEAQLELGDVQAVTDGIGELVERHPLRERLQAARMSALHRSGRRTEALSAYDVLRQLLARELGLAPSPPLEALYRSILQDGPQPFRGSAPGSGRTLLPPDAADFTGHRAQVRELTEALRGGRGQVAVLVGPAGVGKTALATHVAHRLREDFPDGRLLVNLRSDDGTPRGWTSVLAELLQVTGLTGRVPELPGQAAAVWRGWLADRRVLLVLDDAPDESAVRALLPGSWAGAAIVTSRTQLAGLAPVHRVEVPPYSDEEALELLGRIIGGDRVRSDPDAARQIVAASGLLPLAVRVSGLRLAVLRHLPLAEYAARLADPGTVLDELAVGDIAVRPRLETGWRDLTEAGRRALLRLGRLPLALPFTLQDAAAALGCGLSAALRELEFLIDTGAVTSPAAEVTAHAVLYALPRLTQVYARERALAAESLPAGELR